MGMIVVNAVVTSTSEDITAMQEAIRVMEVASRAEAGCDDYTFSVELNNTSVLRITEKWHSIEALKAHMESPHMEAFQQAMGEHPPKAMALKFYEVTEIQPF
jgi:quinol monooxygenase YgiN